MDGRVDNRPDNASLLRRGLALEWLTIVYNAGEAAVALTVGVLAGSIALVGFGLDSIIEVLAAWAVWRRLAFEFRGGDAAETRRLEHRALRVVGVTFFLLSAYVLFEAGSILLRVRPPDVSPIGLALAGLSAVLMPILATAKHRTGRAVGSRALVADAVETWMCWYLSVTLLVGLGLNALFGWWWADPVAALAMVPFMIHEGREALEESRED